MRTVFPVGNIVTLRIIADRPRHRAVFGIGIDIVADTLVIRRSRIVFCARIIRLPGPAENSHFISVHAFGCRSDGIARIQRRLIRIIFIEVEREITGRLADVDDVRGVTVRILHGTARIDRRRIFGFQRIREEIPVVRKTEGREVFRERIQSRRVALFRFECLGRRVICHGIADRVVDRVIRICAERLRPHAVRVVVVPVDIGRQVENGTRRRIRFYIFRGNVEDVCRTARRDLRFQIIEIIIRVRFISVFYGDLEILAERLGVFLFQIVCILGFPLTDELSVRDLVRFAREDVNAEVVLFPAARKQTEAQGRNHHDGNRNDSQFFQKLLHS